MLFKAKANSIMENLAEEIRNSENLRKAWAFANTHKLMRIGWKMQWKKDDFLKCLSSILALTVVSTSIGLPAGTVPAEPDEEKQLHSITVDSGMTNGKVTANYKKTVSGETVYLSVIPDEEYEMTADSLKVNGEKVTGNSFVMLEQDVTIKAEFTQSQITGIRVKTQPDKTEYQINETLDLAGLVLEATYLGDSTKEIIAGYEVSRVDMSTPGTKTVIVTYLGQTTELAIEVLKRCYSQRASGTFLWS